MLELMIFPVGTYVPDPTDTTGYNNDKIGVSFVTFDSTSGSSGKATPRIFVGVATVGSNNLFVSNDAGSTCMHDVPHPAGKETDFETRVCHSGHQYFMDSTQGCPFSG